MDEEQSDYSSGNTVGNYHMNGEHCKIASTCGKLLISVFILTLNKTSKSLHMVMTLPISTGKGRLMAIHSMFSHVLTLTSTFVNAFSSVIR